MLASFLIGLREGLEAALVVGILAAYLGRIGRRDVLPRLWAGVAAAIALSVGIGAVLTYGAYELTFEAQEIIGGGLSLLAVAMVTWMIFWMQRAGRTMKRTLEGDLDRVLARGGLWGIVVIGFVSVGREGLETTLLLWSMVRSFGSSPLALTGAVLGILCAAAVGWVITKGALRLDLGRFFTGTGAVLLIVAAGVLAYAVMDLQEARVFPGPFSAGAPIDPITGGVQTGFAGFPLGYAFDISAVLVPGAVLHTILQATIGLMPVMTWLQVLAWLSYLVIAGTFFVRGVRRSHPRPAAESPPARVPFTHQGES